MEFTSGNQHEFDVPRDHKNIVEAAIHNGEYYTFSSLEFSKNTPPIVVNTKFIKFTNAQKNSLLFRYGELQVEFSNIRCEEVFYILGRLVEI